MRRMARGEGKAGCIFWGLIFFVIAMTAYKIVPARIAAAQLEDHMKELALMQSLSRADREPFIKSIKKRADELGLPVEEKNIEVEKQPRHVFMRVKFTIVIDFIVTEYPMDFELKVDREIFLS